MKHRIILCACALLFGCGSEITPASVLVTEAGAGGCKSPGTEGETPACPEDCGLCGECDGQQCVPIQDAYHVCRVKAGFCDLPEICDGESVECPADEIVDEGQWPGEFADPDCGGYMCDGVSKDCPVTCEDQFDCFPGNYCDGDTSECLPTSQL